MLLLSPYHTGSHKIWAEGYGKNSRHNFTLLTMAGRFWKWRMQGGALELAQQVGNHCQTAGRPDALLVTDMVNLPALLALSRPWLDGVPVLLYVHENQLTYPPPPGEKRDLTYGMINVLSMAAADAIAFNSRYHLGEFFDELPRLLKHFPDYNHLEIIPRLRAKSHVLPVGLELSWLDQHQPSAPSPSRPAAHSPLRILWNQRWEYDKNPAEFFAALYALDDAGLPFQVIVAGENFRQQPAEFAEARERLGERVIHFGFAKDRKTYARLLWEADVVVSTAHHEFFGISILEAIYCGCYPLLPHRLSYPELLPAPHHHAHLYRDPDDLVTRLRWAVTHPAAVRAANLRPIAAAYDWRAIAPSYDTLIDQIIDN
jgi:glycosyltransferase involved in cell wall biosynthesis